MFIVIPRITFTFNYLIIVFFGRWVIATMSMIAKDAINFAVSVRRPIIEVLSERFDREMIGPTGKLYFYDYLGIGNVFMLVVLGKLGLDRVPGNIEERCGIGVIPRVLSPKRKEWGTIITRPKIITIIISRIIKQPTGIYRTFTKVIGYIGGDFREPPPTANPEGTQPPMMSFKAFLAAQDDNISDSEAVEKYNDYKLEFQRQQLNEFFVAHKDDEWYVSYLNFPLFITFEFL